MVLFLSLVLAGCTGEQAPPEEAEVAASEAQAPVIPPAMVYIQHPVEDFDAWLPHYDAFEDKRVAANVVAMWVYRDLDQPDVVHGLHGAGDVETLQSFAQMEELRNAMQEAGVSGPPRFDYLNIVVETVPESPIESQYNVLVRHEVADWDVWKAAFDEHADARDAAGLTSRGVARGVDNPNMVYINFAASDLDAARAFAASEDLKAVMESAGVLGAPEMYFTETVRSM